MASSKPHVSVILPFYNAPFLQEAIDSILNQTFQDYELLLIDNGSDDTSAAVAQSFSSHPNVRLVHESRRGVVHAANQGIKQAQGEYIARMDADDISSANRLAEQVKKLDQDSSIGVVSGQIQYLGSEENEGFIMYVNWLNAIKTEEEIYLNQFVEFPLANPTLMVRKQLFLKYGLYKNGDFPEDYEFFLRLKASRIKMTKTDGIVLTWRDTESRLTRTDERYSQDAFFRIKAQYLFRWLAEHNPFHPKVFIWGAGRLSRRRSDYLIEEGVEVIKYIDLKESAHAIHFDSIPKPEKAFIVSYVANRGAREEIRSFLNERGYQEGLNYILAS